MFHFITCTKHFLQSCLTVWSWQNIFFLSFLVYQEISRLVERPRETFRRIIIINVFSSDDRNDHIRHSTASKQDKETCEDLDTNSGTSKSTVSDHRQTNESKCRNGRLECWALGKAAIDIWREKWGGKRRHCISFGKTVACQALC